jgi:pPIWI RE three-gene island domain Z
MRNITVWRKSLEAELTHQLRGTGLSAVEVCEVELGLYLLAQIDAQQSPLSLWPILTGYQFFTTQSETQSQMIFQARHFLHSFRSQYAWKNALERYIKVKDSLRGYDVDLNENRFSQREIALCRDRWSIYHAALTQRLPYHQTVVKWATAGSYRVKISTDQITSVVLPDVSSFSVPPQKYLLGRARKRLPLEIRWDDLVEIAQWMDQIQAAKHLPSSDWEKRLTRGVRLETFNESGGLRPSKRLILDGIAHLAGMVSSGKSTLMDILTIWAARNGLHITLVVSDVISAINRAAMFRQFDLKAAPVLGTDRRSHLNRLHQIVSARQSESSLIQYHEGFRWLSTACPLNGLRQDVGEPFEINMRPCRSLKPISIGEAQKGEEHICPFFTVCPYHQGQRDLVESNIWIVTPASLVHARVPHQINSESIRFAELISQRSDLVIIDEADRVQVQLDEAFSPQEVLFSAGASKGWLDNLERQVGFQTEQRGRGHVADRQVEAWRRAFHSAQDAADAVYRLISDKKNIREWLRRLEYFTNIALFDSLALSLAGKGRNPGNRSQFDQGQREILQREFNNLIDNGLRELFGGRVTPEPKSLLDLAEKLSRDTEACRSEISSWIAKHHIAEIRSDEVEDLADRLILAILIAILSNRLNVLLERWREVEDRFQLERSASSLSYRSPHDYQSLLPVTPIGNVLAFQFLEDQNKTSTLKFFRCTGVGRWLMLHLHDMLAAEGIAGPNVLLMSGTSWANHTPSYHVQVPVTGILRSPQSETDAVARSHFEFLPLRDEHGDLIYISGLNGELRADALQRMLDQLAQPGSLNALSILEREIDNLPPHRRRVLLVVGSYQEAKVACEHLQQIRPDWKNSGAVRQLVPDDASSEEKAGNSVLPRGIVDQFTETGASILIAPLLAIERGHNILADEMDAEEEVNGGIQKVAAIGAVYFLVRPHPLPHDLAYAIRALNSWAVKESLFLPKARTINDAGIIWRKQANEFWHKTITTDWIYSHLEGKERDQLTWHLMVSMWQVIGRLVRGGVEARVYFCDAKFDPMRCGLKEKDVSLLAEMRRVLHPYFSDDSNSTISQHDRAIVSSLYRPLFQALEKLR